MMMGSFSDTPYYHAYFLASSWYPDDLDREVEINIYRTIFYQFDINSSYFLKTILKKQKAHNLKKARSSNVYTPGTNGLSIKEELMQKTWHPDRIKKLSNKYGYNMLGEHDGGYKKASRKTRRKSKK